MAPFPRASGASQAGARADGNITWIAALIGGTLAPKARLNGVKA